MNHSIFLCSNTFGHWIMAFIKGKVTSSLPQNIFALIPIPIGFTSFEGLVQKSKIQWIPFCIKSSRTDTMGSIYPEFYTALTKLVQESFLETETTPFSFLQILETETGFC